MIKYKQVIKYKYRKNKYKFNPSRNLGNIWQCESENMCHITIN